MASRKPLWLFVMIAAVTLLQCALSDGQPCGTSTDCRTGYLCYWAGNETCGSQGQCHKLDVEATCSGELISACGCDGRVVTRSKCQSFTNPVRDVDASGCDGGHD